ncbi:DUF2341 domain-containing protein, partial [Candidatus Peregrinibacteria bacterium]|nr:DUF2341 domain-containing protein [Candidatus Peregrinibacteria bacterium]
MKADAVSTSYVASTYGIYVETSVSVSIISDFNLFHRIQGSGFAANSAKRPYTAFWTAAQANLYGWRARSGQDLNSFDNDPGLTGDYSIPATSVARGLGQPISYIDKDVDGDTRSTTNPDLGADERTGGSALSGTKTVKPDGTGDYTTVRNALSDLHKRGISGNTVIEVYGTETFETQASALGGWSTRTPIRITNSGGSTLTNYQVLVTLEPNTFNYTIARIDGSDIRFTDSDGTTLLDYWMESWSYNGTSYLWVEVPSIPVGTTTIYINFGNSAALSQSSVSNTFVRQIGTVAATGLYAQWLMEDAGATITDSGGIIANNGTATGTTIVAGYNGNARQFNGTSSDYIAIPDSTELKPTNQITFEAWAYYSNSWSSYVADSRILSKTENGGYQIGINESTIGGQGWVGALVRRNGAYAIVRSPRSELAAGWHHFRCTYDGRYTRFYIDGVLKSVDDAGGYYAPQYVANSLIIGAEAGAGAAPAGNYFQGIIDEVRIYDRALDGSIKGAWALDEAGLLTDYSGRGYNGTATGTTIVTGKIGNARNFNGVSDYITVGDIDSPGYALPPAPSAGEVTISAWVKFDDLSGHRTIFKDGGYQRGIEFGVYNNELHLAVENNDSHRSLGYSTAGLNTGQWYHVAGVADGPNGDMYIYVNGVSVASNTTMSAFTDYNGANGAYIGNAGDQSPTSDENMGVQSYFFDGVIDEVHVYNRILTEAEISDLYSNAGYVTTNYPGIELVRKFSSPEPTVKVGISTGVYNGALPIGRIPGTSPSSVATIKVASGNYALINPSSLQNNAVLFANAQYVNLQGFILYSNSNTEATTGSVSNTVMMYNSNYNTIASCAIYGSVNQTFVSFALADAGVFSVYITPRCTGNIIRSNNIRSAINAGANEWGGAIMLEGAYATKIYNNMIW